jgi:hypothetical protein
LVFCALIAALWALAHLPMRRHWAAGALAGVVLQAGLLLSALALPYVALAGTVSPVIGWGFVLGHSGMAGLLAGVSASIIIGAWSRQGGWRNFGWLALVAVIAWAAGDRPPASLRTNTSVHAAHVRWDGPGKRGMDEVVDRLQKIANAADAVRAVDAQITTLVFPEGVLGDMIGRMDAVFEAEVVAAAKRNKMQIIVGADQRLPSGAAKVGYLAVQPNGEVSVHFARQPMPVSLWRPWSPTSYEANWGRDPMLKLADGRWAYVSVCFEDLVPGLFVSAVMGTAKRPDMVISMANDWWMPSDKAAWRQSLAIEGMARAFGLPIVRAVNLPPREARQRSG